MPDDLLSASSLLPVLPTPSLFPDYRISYIFHPSCLHAEFSACVLLLACLISSLVSPSSIISACVFLVACYVLRRPSCLHVGFIAGIFLLACLIRPSYLLDSSFLPACFVLLTCLLHPSYLCASSFLPVCFILLTFLFRPSDLPASSFLPACFILLTCLFRPSHLPASSFLPTCFVLLTCLLRRTSYLPAGFPACSARVRTSYLPAGFPACSAMVACRPENSLADCFFCVFDFLFVYHYVIICNFFISGCSPGVCIFWWV